MTEKNNHSRDPIRGDDTQSTVLKAMKTIDLLRRCLVIYLKYGLWGDGIRLETTTNCQLRCPLCHQSRDEKRVQGKGCLKFEDFKKFVDMYPEFRQYELSNDGEMFLNPELPEMIKYGHEKGLDLTATNGVNLNTVDDDVLEALVKYRFRTLTVSIDGVTNETYRIYRRGGDFDTVLRNVHRINEFKEKYHSEFPRLIWQFVVFGHNEHELAAAKEKAREVGMDFQARFNWSPDWSPVKDEEAVREKMGAYSRDEYEKKEGKMYIPACRQLWASPQINWDGQLLGCCINSWVGYGNVFKEGLGKCVRSERYRYAKKMLRRKRDPINGIACTCCGYYWDKINTDNPIDIFKGIDIPGRISSVMEKKYS